MKSKNKIDYVKIRGIIAIIIIICGSIYSKIDKLDNYDESTQGYIIAIFNSKIILDSVDPSALLKQIADLTGVLPIVV